MFYVLVAADGSVDRYPYSLTDLKRDHPNTSFPETISDELAADYNMFPVTPAEQPIYDYRYNLERTAVQQDGSWVEVWTQVPASAEEILQRTEIKEQEVDAERDHLLSESDWTQLPDSQVDQQEWAAYRQQLRDVTEQPGYPWDVIWPVDPSYVWADVTDGSAPSKDFRWTTTDPEFALLQVGDRIKGSDPAGAIPAGAVCMEKLEDGVSVWDQSTTLSGSNVAFKVAVEHLST